MAFHGPFTSVPPHFQGFGVPPSLSHPYSYFAPPNSSAPSHGQHATSQHAAIGLQNRIGVLETQLAHVQGEKASMHAAIQYLLETLAATTGARSSSLDRSGQELSMLRLRLALTRKENHRLKVKLRKTIISKASGLKFRHVVAKGGVIMDQRGDTFGSDDLISTDSPDGDLLGGAIPFSIIERYPTASSSSTNQSYGQSPPDLGASDDDRSSSESESESSSPGATTKYDQSGPYHRQGDKKNSSSGVIPDLHLNKSSFTENTCSSESQLPYVQYFSPSFRGAKVGIAQHKEEKVKAFTAPRVYLLLVVAH